MRAFPCCMMRILLLLTASLFAASNSVPPSIIAESKVEPQYTDQARDAKISGIVLLKLYIDDAGVPTNIQVLRPLGFGLDEKAMEAILQWRFRPAQQNGMPVATSVNVEVNFRLTDSPPPADV